MLFAESAFAAPADDFVITVKTDNQGTSTNTQFTVPVYDKALPLGYNFNVDCNDDGTNETTGQTGQYICSYSTPGTYTVRIKDNSGVGTGYPQVHFNARLDAKKLLTIVQWGTGKWVSMQDAFMGCTNLIGSSTIDAPDLSSVTLMTSMFRNSSFNQDINSWYGE